jgi:hypothetical protein
VIRFLGIVAAVALIGYPSFLIYGMTVPVPRFRTGGYVDFLAFAVTISAVYGGVFVGIAVHGTRTGRAWHHLRTVEVLKAGVTGALAVGVVFIVGAGFHGLATRASFEKGIGNLWGLVLIFGVLFGALVSAGVALLFHGLRPSAGASGPTPGNGGSRMRSGPPS